MHYWERLDNDNDFVRDTRDVSMKLNPSENVQNGFADTYSWRKEAFWWVNDTKK